MAYKSTTGHRHWPSLSPIAPFLQLVLDLLGGALHLALGLLGSTLGFTLELAGLSLGLAFQLGSLAAGLAVRDVLGCLLDLAGDGLCYCMLAKLMVE